MASRFAVLGSPIAHSRSPLLHNAAIRALGIDADYTSAEVNESELASFLDSCDEEFEGFSLTMPLKQAIRPLLASECAVSATAGAVNTIVRGADGWHGFNTDVWGAKTAIAQSLGSHFRTATILGNGATAASIVLSLRDLGVSDVTVIARSVDRAHGVAQLATRVGLSSRIVKLGSGATQSDLLVNTVPGNTEFDPADIEDIDAGALFDVSYSPWPSALAREWSARGLPSSNGLLMLLWQAVLQARVFYGGDIDEELPNESLVITAMRSAVGL